MGMQKQVPCGDMRPPAPYLVICLVEMHHRTRCAHCAQALIAFDDVGCDRRAYICVRRVPGGEYGDTRGGTQWSRNEHRALPAGTGAAPGTRPPPRHYRLGVLYQKLGRWSDSRTELQKFLGYWVP